MRTIISLFALACLLSSCKKCESVVFCSAPNPAYFEVHGGDTATVYVPNAFVGGYGYYGFQVFGRNVTNVKCEVYDQNRLVYTLDSLNGYWNGLANGDFALQLYTVKVSGNTIWGSSFTLNGKVCDICGPMIGNYKPAATQNVFIVTKNIQLPSQNNNGVFDGNMVGGLYLLRDEIIICPF